MRKTIPVLASLLLFWKALPAQAQVQRYVVGQRLVAFDQAWDKYRADPAARKRALKFLLPVVPSLFAARWEEAARLLDQARQALKSKAETPAPVRWAESLYARPEKRLLDQSASSLRVVIFTFYKPDAPKPAGAEVVFQLFDGDKPLTPAEKFTCNPWPLGIKLNFKNLPEGDHTLRISYLVEGKVQASEAQMISVVSRLEARLTVFRQALEKLNDKTTDGETARYLHELIGTLADGGTYETNYPAARLLAEAEGLVQAVQAGKPYYGKHRTGQFWLKLATARGKFPARVLIPAEAKPGKPLPLVVALHGAGASENLYFEGYGNGKIVKMCQERGWLLVSPRSGYLAFNMPVEAIVDEVARLYPVDRAKVFVVGHSMGAAQAIGAIQEQPKLFAAVAALGGSGKVHAPAKVKDVPFFVGVGDSDFALEGARKLTTALKDGGVAQVQFREYADTEHIMIVREALPEVFPFFETALKK